MNDLTPQDHKRCPPDCDGKRIIAPGHVTSLTNYYGPLLCGCVPTDSKDEDKDTDAR